MNEIDKEALYIHHLKKSESLSKKDRDNIEEIDYRMSLLFLDFLIKYENIDLNAVERQLLSMVRGQLDTETKTDE
jgi:hypothetical protein